MLYHRTQIELFFSFKCTLYIVQYTLYIAQCTLYIDQFTLSSV